jgi:hypothetical protein
MYFVMNGTPQISDLAGGDGSEKSLHDMYCYDQAKQPGQYQAVTKFFNGLWTATDNTKDCIIANQKNRIAAFKKANPQARTVPFSVSYYYLSVTVEPNMGINAPVMNCIQV